MNLATKAALYNALIFPGWGQIYLKKYKKGILIITATIAGVSSILWSVVQATISILKIAPFKKELDALIASLPFTLTHAQENALKDIFADFTSPHPMNRLLEGDVGSGKTVVGAIAMYMAHLNGFQSVLMAPTEILANQHFETISKMLLSCNIKVKLFTGSTTKSISNI